MPGVDRTTAAAGARLAGAVAAIVLGTGLMVAEAATVLSSPPPASPVVEVADDDGGRAMFAVDDLAPGRPVDGCVAVRHEGSDVPALRLHAVGHGTPLDPALRLVVEAGSGGRFGDCTGFSGTPVYDGTLEEFNRLHHDFASGLPVPGAAGAQPIAFRFVAEVADDNVAQGRHALATFTWQAEAAAVPVAAPPVAAPSAPAQPVDVAVEQQPGAAPDPTTPAVPHMPAPAETDLPAPVDPAAAAAPARPSRSPLLRPLARPQERSLVEAVAHGVVVVTRKAAFPGALLFVAGAFVLAQDRIDRRDPKLALAPLYPDPDLVFGDRAP